MAAGDVGDAVTLGDAIAIAAIWLSFPAFILVAAHAGMTDVSYPLALHLLLQLCATVAIAGRYWLTLTPHGD
jgi:hypothetical protein